MASFHLLLIAILQGLTEFLPVSSSGHLILLPKLTGLEDQGQAIDVAVHIGTLGAVVLYFWRDVRMAVGGVPRMIYGKLDTPGAKSGLFTDDRHRTGRSGRLGAEAHRFK